MMNYDNDNGIYIDINHMIKKLTMSDDGQYTRQKIINLNSIGKIITVNDCIFTKLFKFEMVVCIILVWLLVCYTYLMAYYNCFIDRMYC
jgi:hypothetical protein